MGGSLTRLNVNPCKMCMPMGAVSAFFGVRGCMTLLHGSQGCATYIRRHMATHYNEPIDIASSSLTEQGTVFGGEANLIKGLENLIALYHPEVIGVTTTCLAETIGEDVPAIVKRFYETHPETTAKIITVRSPGYGGTQYEGFFRSLRAIVEQTEMVTIPNGRINIVAPMLSPADFRYLKALVSRMGLHAIFLPDLSDNLDGVNSTHYDRLPRGGTPLGDIAGMAGAVKTLELTQFPDSDYSPAEYLRDTYGIPFVRIPVPSGLAATDALVRELCDLGGLADEELRSERGRLIDAMVDAHKYCARAKAAVFGEPDFVFSTARLCAENGIVPAVIATGSVCPALRGVVGDGMGSPTAKPPIILDDCDFDAIEGACRSAGVNVMIGSSDARRAAGRLGIPLIRCAFPIHDRVGGQSIRTVGYEGTRELMQLIANSMLIEREESYRAAITGRYFPEKAVEPAASTERTLNAAEMEKRTLDHPCYTCGSCENARIHLPIAPKCNIQCNYCVRKYDCPNESRPGVTSDILTPAEAAAKYRLVKEKVPNLKVVGIAGPGDSLANFDQTRETLRLIREADPEVIFCLSTNGLLLPLYAEELLALGVTHLTVTMNAVDPAIGAKIYSHIDYFGKRFTGEAAAAILMANQLAGIQYLTAHGAAVKVNTVVLKGINDTHVEEVVKKVSELGVTITNIMQLIPVPESKFEGMELVSNKELGLLRKSCEQYVKQMYHCKQCRADAIGPLNADRSIEFRGSKSEAVPEKTEKAMRIAVASRNGMTVDTHFGQADEFYIYESDGKSARFIEKRSVEKYCTGNTDCGEGKIDRIIATIADCTIVLSLRIGDVPSKKLSESGIRAVSTYESVETAVISAAVAKASS